MKKNNKMKMYDAGGTTRQPFTFPYTQEEIDQINQGQQMQGGQNSYNQEIQKLPPYMQSGMYADAQKTENPVMSNLQSAPMQNLPVNYPSTVQQVPQSNYNFSPNKETGKVSTGQKVTQGITNVAGQVGAAAGQLFSGAYAAIPAITSLLPDQRNKKIRPDMEQAYTQNPYGNTEGGLYANGGALKYKTVHRNEGGIDVTEEIPIYDPVQPVQNSVQYQEPFPLPPNKQKITYEKLNYGNQQRFSPVFNGEWSNNEREQAFTNGTIPSNYQGIPVNNQSDWHELWNGVNQYTNSNQWYPSNGQEVNRTKIDISSNMGANYKTKSPYYNPYMKNGGTLQTGQELELSLAEIASLKAMGYKFK